MNITKKKLKLQSAMEYLMTYGWAILIIAVVLGALFSLGVFSGASLLGTSCIGASGFLCSGLSYSHTTGNLAVTVGQSTGSSWAAADVVFVPQGWASTSGIPNVPSASNYALGAFPSGASTAIASLPVVLPGASAVQGAVSVGSTIAGSIWACYGSVYTAANAFTTACTGTGVGYVQIATLTAKAT